MVLCRRSCIVLLGDLSRRKPSRIGVLKASHWLPHGDHTWGFAHDSLILSLPEPCVAEIWECWIALMFYSRLIDRSIRFLRRMAVNRCIVCGYYTTLVDASGHFQAVQL
jgi:hypothetical protein